MVCGLCDTLFLNAQTFDNHMKTSHSLICNNPEKREMPSSTINQTQSTKPGKSAIPNFLVLPIAKSNAKVGVPKILKTNHAPISKPRIIANVRNPNLSFHRHPLSENSNQTAPRVGLLANVLPADKLNRNISQPVRLIPLKSQNNVNLATISKTSTNVNLANLSNLKLISLPRLPSTTANLTPSTKPGISSHSNFLVLPIVPNNAQVGAPDTPKTNPTPIAKQSETENIDVDLGEENLVDPFEIVPLQSAPTALNTGGSIVLDCQICNIAIGDEKMLEKHNEIHATNPHQCRHCRIYCNSIYDLYLHQRETHNIHHRMILRSACKYCSKFFVTAWQCEAHEGKCKKKFPPHPCKYCDERFTTNYQLKKHLRVGTDS